MEAEIQVFIITKVFLAMTFFCVTHTQIHIFSDTCQDVKSFKIIVEYFCIELVKELSLQNLFLNSGKFSGVLLDKFLSTSGNRALRLGEMSITTESDDLSSNPPLLFVL